MTATDYSAASSIISLVDELHGLLLLLLLLLCTLPA